MFLRALIAFLALPGVVAFLVPAIVVWRRGAASGVRPLGMVHLALGVAALLWCVREFYVAGKGTLAPWSPPVHLVVSGPYRYSRNPMYLAVLTVVTGWAHAFASWGLLPYAGALLVAFELRIRHGEEPWLSRRHGAAWIAYAARVRRWL